MSKNLKQKMLEARKIISGTKMEKKGKNKYSNYDYFTPDQVNVLVADACQKTGILPVFSLKNGDYGMFGVLDILDSDSDDSLQVVMHTAIPDIKATNVTQQVGGAVTYTERYLKMSAFGITDNSLDFDSQDNRGVSEVGKQFIPDTMYNRYMDSLSKKDSLTEKQFNDAKSALSKYDEDDKLKEIIDLINSKKPITQFPAKASKK